MGQLAPAQSTTAAVIEGSGSGSPSFPAAAPEWGDFVERGFPFFSSVLDARNLGPGWPEGNLTPRGIILNLGHDCWACFDTDLLRVAAVWTGAGVSPVSMSQGSYHVPGAKAPEGQGRLPRIAGTPWLANGIYPGWQTGETVQLSDPRSPGPDAREVGRGPIDPRLGRFEAIRHTRGGVVLEYEVAGVPVREWIEARVVNARPQVRRRFRLDAVPQPLILVVGQRPPNKIGQVVVSLAAEEPAGPAPVEVSTDAQGLTVVRIPFSRKPVEFSVLMGLQPAWQPWVSEPGTPPPPARWPQTVVTSGRLAPDTGPYVVDNITLPLANPWRRNVRLADIAFFTDGRAAMVTFDGDVWLVTGLTGDLRRVTWKRYASGFHEPLALCTRNDELFVFDRNGIWRLRGGGPDGEAEVHELFSNAFAQTAETREFASGLRVAPDDSFIIAKGGQQGSTTGIHNGSVLRISPDGKSSRVLGWGLRQPFIGVNPVTGLITASDQEGNYVPTTPLHVIRDGQFYGFLTGLMPKEKYPAPIADALTWIPHTINASAAGQVWLHGARMGPLNEACILVSYYRPELFLALFNERPPQMQAAVVSLTKDLIFAPLNGAVNPADGQLYVTGFQIWGTIAPQISGLARVRYTGVPCTLPREVAPMTEGVLLRFDAPLGTGEATNPANYWVERWNYRRSADYGSPHLKLDGHPGQETLTPSSAYLSRDGRTVFVGLPDMRQVMQMRVGWSLATAAGSIFTQNAYFTVHALPRFDPLAEGFTPLTVDLTPRTAPAGAAPGPVTVAEGRRLASLFGCAACHSTDGTLIGKVGPSWKGLFGSTVTFADGRQAIANQAYLRESILEPKAKIVRGFDKSDAGMPSYQGIITSPQIDALILYIKSLR